MRAQLNTPSLLLIGIVPALSFQAVFAAPPVIPAEGEISNVYQLVTPTPDSPPAQTIPSEPPLSLTLSLVCFCLVLLLIIGVFVLGVVVRNQPRKKNVDD